MYAMILMMVDQENARVALDLQRAGLSATRQRRALMSALRASAHPQSVESLVKVLGTKMNPTTVYRALDQLIEVRLARRVDLGKNYALFESMEHHHHHLVCRSCGRVEDVSACLPPSVSKKILLAIPHFVSIEDHALEFFGICKTCAKK